MRVEDYAKTLYKYVNMKSPPVLLEPIVDELGVTLYYDDKIIVDGLTVKTPSMKIIFVNSSYPKTRQRFILAHEIGHIVMPHKPETYSCIIRNNRRPMERDANRFAAELLMPQLMLEPLWEQFRGNRQYRYQIVAEKLEVSAAALKARVRALGFR